MSNKAERAAFERNAITQGYRCDRRDNGDYYSGDVQLMWESWQARGEHDLQKALEASRVDEGELRAKVLKAVEEGNAEYWRPTREHDNALRVWKKGGFKGKRPESNRSDTGSIIDCISASVNQMLSQYLRLPTRQQMPRDTRQVQLGSELNVSGIMQQAHLGRLCERNDKP